MKWKNTADSYEKLWLERILQTQFLVRYHDRCP